MDIQKIMKSTSSASPGLLRNCLRDRVADTGRKPVSRAAAPDATADQGRAKIARQLLARFYLRFHISLILLWSFSAGFLVNKAMLWAGVHSMLLRYPMTLLVSYGAFFLGVRIWLAYVGAEPFGSGRFRGSSLVDNRGNGSGFDPGSWRGTGSGTAMRGAGGDFGGGGASGSFAADSDSIADAASNAGAGPARSGSWFSWGGSGSASGKGGGGGIDLDLGDGDGWLVVLLLVLVAVLLSSVFGAVIYLVYSAPAVLADVAFQAMLAGGLVRPSQRWRDASWEMRLLKSTWIPFAIVFLLALVTAGLAVKLFPAAHTLPEVIRAARDYLG
jgi:hypothetical protein